jgi:hypothetical protein
MRMGSMLLMMVTVSLPILLTAQLFFNFPAGSSQVVFHYQQS